MSVRAYYYQHFDELTPDKKFHFATRIKNYFKSDDFGWFFEEFIPSTDLSSILANNDFSVVNQANLRRPYFEKYDHLFAIEAALFRVKHLLNEYNIDLRAAFLKQIPQERLYALVDAILDDDGAIFTLSSWAINTICLTEELFPRSQNVVRTLAERVIHLGRTVSDKSPLLLVYLYTHIIICDTNFYMRPVSESTLEQELLDRCAEVIEKNFANLSLDSRLEFLVCANLVGEKYPTLRARIAMECQEILSKHDYLYNLTRSAKFHTPDGAEHLNVLFIMSGLDDELSIPNRAR